MQKHKRRRLALETVAALIWTALTLLSDRIIFDYDLEQGTVWIYKALFFGLAFGLIHGAVTLVGKLRRKERFAKRCVLWTLPYLSINLLLLLLIWPGAWGNDDLHVFELACSLQLTAWYHYLSSVYQILVLMLIPLLAGTVIVQICVASGIVGYLMASIQELAEKYCVTHGRSPRYARWTAVVYLPLILPPILLHNQEAFRPTWTSWTEIFLLGLLGICLANKRPLSRGKMCLLIFLGALTATWRSECIYYLLLMPIFFFLFAHRRQLNYFSAVWGSVLVIALTLISNHYNSVLMGGSSWSYQSVAFYRQIVTAVKAADPVQDAGLLEKIDPVFDVEDCWNYLGPISGAHDEVIQSDVTQKKWNECVKASAQLILRHPMAVLKERWELFVNTVHYTIFSGQKSVFITSSEFYERPEDELRDIQKNFLDDPPLLGTPINNGVRSQVMNILLDWKVPSNRMISLSWNMIPFFALLLILQVIFTVWHKWGLFWINACGVLHVGVVLVSAPTSYFMYYLAPYMQGAITAGVVLLWVILHLPVKPKSKIQGGSNK